MPKIHNAPSASGQTGWTTDPELYRRLNAEFKFKLDAAADAENALCDRFMDAVERDAFTTPWEPGPIYCNPPYGLVIPSWLQRGLDEFRRTILPTVFLLPAATETKWFQDIAAKYAKEIRLIKGRLKFGNVICKDGTVGTHFATFPSAVIIFAPRSVRQFWTGADIRTWDWRKE